jgi:SAM-dependent methyltransferase
MPSSSIVVDELGLVLPIQHEEQINVAFDGRWICSFSAERGRRDDETRTIRWPTQLRRFLDGTAVVEITEGCSGQPVFEGPVAFGTGTGQISVVDHLGRPLIIDKWSKLERPFDDSEPRERSDLVQVMLRLLNDLTDHVGMPTFAIYGTLLGAVRTGRIIEHDVDLDIAYFSERSHPADLAIEARQVTRRLRQLGWTVHNPRAARLKVMLDEPYADRHIDVFVSYYCNGRFNVDRWVDGELDRGKVLPLSSVMLEGHSIPAPADPESVLALTYGPSWRVPDPGFSFVEDTAHARRIAGWMGRNEYARLAWQTYHSESPASPTPSQFADWVKPQLDPDTTLLDLGCGRGSDTIALADGTRAVHGWDYISSAVKQARAAAAAAGSTARFQVINIADVRLVLPSLALVADPDGPHAIYGRFILDALLKRARANVWMIARALLRPGGRAYFEFRAAPGRPLRDPPFAHWARPIKLADLRREIREHSGEVIHHEVMQPAQWRQAIDPTGDENLPFPPMHRIVAQW